MDSFLSKSITTFTLRFLSIVAKFTLFLFMGKYLSEANVGIYGMIATTIAMLMQIIGLEFHYYNTREIQKKKVGERGPLIRDQFILHLISYSFSFPFLILFFSFGFIDFSFIFLFYGLLLFEHLSQELFRILAANQLPIQATFNLFIRTVPWVLVSCSLIFKGYTENIVNSILLSWIICSFLCFLLGVFQLKHELNRQILSVKINWAWIKKGLFTIVPFVITSGAFAILVAVDKFLIKLNAGDELLGIYFFMFSLAGGYYTLLSFSVGVIYGPKVLHAYHNESIIKFLEIRREGLIKTFAVGAILIPPAAIGIYIVLYLIDNSVYSDNLHIYYLLLLANILWAFSDLLNFDLYIRGLDKLIMYSAIGGVMVSVILQSILVPIYSIEGAAIGSVLSFVALGIFRYISLKKYVKNYSILMKSE